MKSCTTRATIQGYATRGFFVRVAGAVYPRSLGCGVGLWQHRWRSTHVRDGSYSNQPDSCLASGRQESVGNLPLPRERFLGRTRLNRQWCIQWQFTWFSEKPVRGRCRIVRQLRTAAGAGQNQTLATGRVGPVRCSRCWPSDFCRKSRRCRYMAYRRGRWIVAVFSPPDGRP